MGKGNTKKANIKGKIAFYAFLFITFCTFAVNYIIF